MNLREVTDRREWDALVSVHPWGHPLQLWGWGEAKRSTHWAPHRLVLEQDGRVLGGAQVLLWPIPKLGRFIAYVPRGPVMDPVASGELLDQLAAWAKEQKALYLRLEPAWHQANLPKGWRRAANGIQMSETYTIDLTKTEDEILEPMARKHRQYIRKAEREGVTVERISSGPATSGTPDRASFSDSIGESLRKDPLVKPEDDSLQPMYDLYFETASRAGFGIHSQDYYEQLHRELGDHSYLYYALVEDKPVAFLWLAAAGPVAYELYGGISSQGQEWHANYLLKWHAIEAMKAAGLTSYDFNGRLNEGVSQFKSGFGPDATDYVGTYDYPFNKLGYHAWETLWPVAKPLGRRLAKLGRKR